MKLSLIAHTGVPLHTQQLRLLRDCTISLRRCSLLPAAVKTAQNKAVLQCKMGETVWQIWIHSFLLIS